jgi:hypothetical protein
VQRTGLKTAIIAFTGQMALPAIAHGTSFAKFFNGVAVGPVGNVAEALGRELAPAGGADSNARDATGMPVLKYDAEFDASARAQTLINAGATR